MILWYKIAIGTSILLLFVTGFAFGYLYSDTSCIEDPIKYTILKMNELNNEDYVVRFTPSNPNRQILEFDKEGSVNSIAELLHRPQ